MASLTEVVRQGSYVEVSGFSTETKRELIERYHIPLENRDRTFKQPGRLVLVVMSQDCDIDKDEQLEHCIELVLAKKSGSPSQAIQFTKSAQKLPFLINGVQYELNINKRFFVPKPAFIELFGAEMNPWDRVDRSALDMMRDWMSVRYERHPFPSRFDLAFRGEIQAGESRLRSQSHKIQAIAVFLDEQVREIPEYHCHLKIVTYSTVEADEISEISEFLKDLVLELQGKQKHPKSDDEPAYINFYVEEAENVPEGLENIVTTSWQSAVRPEAFTLEDFRNCQFYNLNYLCYEEQ